MSRKAVLANLVIGDRTAGKTTAVTCLFTLALLTACGVPPNPAPKANSAAFAMPMSGSGIANTVPPQNLSPLSKPAELDNSSGNTTKNPDATFKGCWYKQGKNRYQAVDVSVKNPGKYPFNALLYYGKTCNPDDYADQFGYGQLLNFGGFGYTFWFAAFANQSDMSALWYVGEDESKCMSYADAPDC
jgi:hypothetical protein